MFGGLVFSRDTVGEAAKWCSSEPCTRSAFGHSSVTWPSPSLRLVLNSCNRKRLRANVGLHPGLKPPTIWEKTGPVVVSDGFPSQSEMVHPMEFLRHLRDKWLRLPSTSPVLEYAGDCPHCQERTTWSVRMLNGYARCQQCDRNPLQRSVPENRNEPEAHVPA